MKSNLLLAPLNMVKYQEAFPLFQDGILRTGGHKTHTHFSTPNGPDADIGFTLWVTTMDVDKDELEINESEYESDKYDNYDAINADSLRKIPKDYAGNIGVPITYMMAPNSDYEIIDMLNQPIYHGRKIYSRIIIRRK